MLRPSLHAVLKPRLLMLTFVVGFAACLTFVSDSQAQSQTDDKYVKYANGVLDRYDSNRDGSLDEDEQKEMRDRPIRTIDQNGDGVISHAELVRHYTPPGKQARIARANARPQTRSRFKRKSSDEPISVEDEKAYQKPARRNDSKQSPIVTCPQQSPHASPQYKERN